MTQELIKCPCCDKMVPADGLELSYKLPDAIASMSQEDIDEHCKYTNDYVICNDEYFYIRCTIPLPVHDLGKDYAIGAWAQVSENSFGRIWQLWDDPAQSNEAPVRGLLANNIHLNSNSENSEIEIQLTGPTTRPMITIKDPECSLYKEQQSGITIHRAAEYSDLCR
ncbi:DUF2199 domain-containing protein [Vibrio sp. SCSIO 43137]|uniref:DUF2199 domain-containing protein n=1 Tax=Vibrio sp. SCSIO 43137 TaxID=3021011 RepID=UPI002307F451|nr:DUF2199 domain-containing protein [Vibrio sp. SCSIO 43137]WCE28468.1 DUF2199 domain-containing protein [Vibrio sp. SCSIO 43137]